jgi:subtilisin family serine protease
MFAPKSPLSSRKAFWKNGFNFLGAAVLIGLVSTLAQPSPTLDPNAGKEPNKTAQAVSSAASIFSAASVDISVARSAVDSAIPNRIADAVVVRTAAQLPPSGPRQTNVGSPSRMMSPQVAGAASGIGKPHRSRVIVKLRDSLSQNLANATPSGSEKVNIVGASAMDDKLAALLAKHAVRSVTPLSARHVRARWRQGRSRMQVAAATKQKFPKRSARAPANEQPPDLASSYVFDLGSRSAAEVAEAIRSLKSDPDVLDAEEDKTVQALYVPNDPSYSAHGSWGQPYDDLYGLKKIGTTAAWDTTQGQGVIVAVVDTGVDYNHPDIKDNIWINPGEVAGNGTDDDQNGFVDDVRGWDFVGHDANNPVQDNDPYDGNFHGTHVAGIIAATGDNNLGVVGVAWKAKIMIVKALDDNGSGYDSDLAKAIIYAADNGADVINASWGGGGSSQTVIDAINYAHSLGVVFVAAAGNSSTDAKDFFPANVPNAIAVSSLDPYDNLSYFSNFGDKIDVSAPGEDILSLQAGTTGYIRESGTSMAAPHVSGVAALIIALHPTYSNEQVRQALRISATDLGPTGKDDSFGYGRVSADQAVLVSQVLAAKILSPADGGDPISAVTSLTGTVGGPGFDHYVVDFGAGAAPDSWTVIRNGTTSVTDGDIGTFDPTTIPDGIYTVRLRAFNTGGIIFSDQAQLRVRYLEITSPFPPSVPCVTQEVKPGLALPIAGSATGPSFQNYVIEWAPGAKATSGWSTTGLGLTGSGLSPVTADTLGTWTPPANLAAGYYTIRLTVANTGFSSTTTTGVYVEPALVSSGWPQFAQNIWYTSSALPVRQADGSTQFVLCGNGTGSLLYSFSLDGSARTISLNNGTYHQPCVGNLDGQAGDEIVVPDGFSLKILSSDLSLIRTITPGQSWLFGYDQIVLADLDNDGVPEIIAPARDSSKNGFYPSVGIYIYRADGTLFSNSYPLTFTMAGLDRYDGINVLAVDLDGDGKKEIVVAFENSDVNSYTLEAFNADGTRYAGWTTLSFSNSYLNSVVAADLDNDGAAELILSEYNYADQVYHLRVLNHTGELRPGWPVTVESGQSDPRIAIGDLDRNNRREIVAVTESQVSILRDDGSLWCQPWSNGGNPPWNTYTTPTIADIDNDGFPEILIGISTADWDSAPLPFYKASLTSYRRDGTIQQSWPLFGVKGQQPLMIMPLVGDFNGDGQTDLAVTIGLVEIALATPRVIGGPLVDSALTVLTTGTTFNGAASDWTSNFHDPQNSRTASAAPKITAQPFSQMVAAGAPITFFAAAGGSPIPTFQWQKNGINIPNATGSSYTIAHVAAGDAGSYAVVVTNGSGSVTSQSVMLSLAPSRDFNADSQSDIVWGNTVTGEHGIWLMNGSSVVNWANLPTEPTAWRMAGTGDFNGDDQADIIWENTLTGEHGIWLMNGSAVFNWISLPTESTAWRMAGTGDFNGDGQSDILWENTVTGERGIWLMNGFAVTSWVGLLSEPTDWHIVGTGDFNGDGQTDIVWENTATGEHGIWLMNGSGVVGWTGLPIEPTDWRIVGTGDFNGDGQTDIIWENTATGEHGIWLMNGSIIVSWANLPTVSTQWHIVR